MDRREICPRNASSSSSVNSSLMRDAFPSVVMSPSDAESKPVFHDSTGDAISSGTPEKITSSMHRFQRGYLHHQQQQQQPVANQWLLRGSRSSSSPPPPLPPPPHPHPPPPHISVAELMALIESSATGRGTFVCNVCGKQFGYKNGLVRHLRLTHAGEKPYQCNICGRRFGYKHILLEHQNLHFGNRPYVCPECDKRFAARSNLIQHQTIHRRPFSCPRCCRRFDREDQLKKHLRVHPDIGGGGSAEESTVWTPLEASSKTHDDSKRRQETLPDSSEEHLSARSLAAVTVKRQPGVAGVAGVSGAGEEYGRCGGNRIDAICSQLSAGKREHVTVKQELVDSTEADGGSDSKRRLFLITPPPVSAGEEALNLRRGVYTEAPLGGSTSSFGEDGTAAAAAAATGDLRIPLGRTDDPPPLQDPPEHRNLSSAALPGICEVFSRRAKPIGPDTDISPLQNAGLVPLSLLRSHFPVPDPDVALRTRPHDQRATTSGQNPPPSTQRDADDVQTRPSSSKDTRDQAIQHSSTIVEYPSLEEVLAYHVNQGRLFRCQHCDILFFERGMYFLHSSLHGTSNPWECSICHRDCLNKNEFILHFVNQQHGF